MNVFVKQQFLINGALEISCHQLNFEFVNNAVATPIIKPATLFLHKNNVERVKYTIGTPLSKI